MSSSSSNFLLISLAIRSMLKEVAAEFERQNSTLGSESTLVFALVCAGSLKRTKSSTTPTTSSCKASDSFLSRDLSPAHLRITHLETTPGVRHWYWRLLSTDIQQLVYFVSISICILFVFINVNTISLEVRLRTKHLRDHHNSTLLQHDTHPSRRTQCR